MRGTFTSSVHAPGYVHGNIAVELQRPFTPDLRAADGTATFEYCGTYQTGLKQAVNVHMKQSEAGAVTIELRPDNIITMFLNMLGAVDITDIRVDWQARQVTGLYKLQLPPDNGTLLLRF